MKLCCATNNPGKLKEIVELLGDRCEIVSLREVGCNEEIPEDFQTIEENSAQKAWYVYDRCHVDCFADDSGLEVEVLNGAPGVNSAFYGGPQKSDADNVKKLLSMLKDIENRKARFRTVITLVSGGEQLQFEGIVNGQIAHAPRGAGGFGYDPVFMPDGHKQTFGEMPVREKNRISHRSVAVAKLMAHLTQTQYSTGR